jgi:hypothetical protein
LEIKYFQKILRYEAQNLLKSGYWFGPKISSLNKGA